MKTKITQNLILVLAFVCFTTNSIAQNKWDTKERIYSNGVVLGGIIDVQQAKLLGLKPRGKNASVKYDPFYDKYTIDWIEEDNASRMILKFKEQNSGGKMYIDTYSDNSTAYFLDDNIADQKKITIMSAEIVMLEGREVKLIIVFDDLN